MYCVCRVAANDAKSMSGPNAFYVLIIHSDRKTEEGLEYFGIFWTVNF